MTRHGMAVTQLVATVLRGKSILAPFAYSVSLSTLFTADFCPKSCCNRWRYRPSAPIGGGSIANLQLLRAVRKAKSS